MMAEKISLKWNDFYFNVSKSFRELRHEEYLQDVTLVSDDNTQISAHKLVLSACSEHFKSIFKTNAKQTNPIIICIGVTDEELRNILDYMYDGQVQIFRVNMARFMEVAKMFKLRGLKEIRVESEKISSRAIKWKDDFKQCNAFGKQELNVESENRIKSIKEMDEIGRGRFKVRGLKEMKEPLLHKPIKVESEGISSTTVMNNVEQSNATIQYITTTGDITNEDLDNSINQVRARQDQKDKRISLSLLSDVIIVQKFYVMLLGTLAWLFEFKLFLHTWWFFLFLNEPLPFSLFGVFYFAERIVETVYINII